MGISLLGAGGHAFAFDFFGLWGSDDAPPAVSPEALPYVMTFAIDGDDKDLLQTVQDASGLYKLRRDAPPEGDSLARRAAKDFVPVIDALWARGYYDAAVVVSIDGAALKIGDDDTAAFSRAAEAYRNRAAVPVKIHVVPGPQFKLRTIRILDAKPNAPFSGGELPPRVIGLKPGDPADANNLRAAQLRMIEAFRAQAHPLAKVVSIVPVVDHSAHCMDVTITLDPGPKAGFGGVKIVGSRSFSPSVVRSYVYIEPGDPYSPRTLATTKTSIREIPAVGSVRITEAGQLDADGNLPITVETGDRPPYAIGTSAKYSTTEGPAAQVYWEDRNVFGDAERLRIEADLLYAPPNDGLVQTYGQFKPEDIGGKISASFVKPALGGSTNDLLVDAFAQKISTNSWGYVGYTLRDVDLTAAIRHRFNDTLSLQIGVEAQRGTTTDILGTINYVLVGVPVSLLYDTTDNKLDPTRGMRLAASVAPYPTFFGSSVDVVQMKAHASAYYSLDDGSNYILAGRVAAGSLVGAALDEIPANMRFYAGGGGSVRGYAYQSIGPMGPGSSIIGGRSLFETSAELRIKVTPTIGVVPFFDAGSAFASSVPDFKEALQMAAGLGLRYYTPIGPIRFDLAAPLNRRPGDKPVAAYVSIGQSF